jgi:hypothetical protein
LRGGPIDDVEPAIRIFALEYCLIWLATRAPPSSRAVALIAAFGRQLVDQVSPTSVQHSSLRVMMPAHLFEYSALPDDARRQLCYDSLRMLTYQLREKNASEYAVPIMEMWRAIDAKLPAGESFTEFYLERLTEICVRDPGEIRGRYRSLVEYECFVLAASK